MSFRPTQKKRARGVGGVAATTKMFHFHTLNKLHADRVKCPSAAFGKPPFPNFPPSIPLAIFH